MTVVLSYLPTVEGRGALAFGFSEARMRGCDLLVIAEKETVTDDVFTDDLNSARAAADAAGVTYRVAESDPGLSHADQLINASYDESVELVVIGLKRRSPVGKLLTGSAMQRVLLDAHCPVAAVKPPVRAAV
ncbi:universal stress protein [Rhodococcus gannanensis]|uniref:Universal stress protein n=1 Tax=Rhodococcus gannanensis TaxID=1960308 RepID=A0ABW4P918_9NOCA